MAAGFQRVQAVLERVPLVQWTAFLIEERTNVLLEGSCLPCLEERKRWGYQTGKIPYQLWPTMWMQEKEIVVSAALTGAVVAVVVVMMMTLVQMTHAVRMWRMLLGYPRGLGRKARMTSTLAKRRTAMSRTSMVLTVMRRTEGEKAIVCGQSVQVRS